VALCNFTAQFTAGYDHLSWQELTQCPSGVRHLQNEAQNVLKTSLFKVWSFNKVHIRKNIAEMLGGALLIGLEQADAPDLQKGGLQNILGFILQVVDTTWALDSCQKTSDRNQL
jgi:hypothetical protein